MCVINAKTFQYTDHKLTIKIEQELRFDPVEEYIQSSAVYHGLPWTVKFSQTFGLFSLRIAMEVKRL